MAYHNVGLLGAK